VSRSDAVVPAVSVLCLFKDGGVGLYQVRRKHWIFNREHGHTETIFDCSFKPDNCDLLATGSFDGSIKVWRVDSLEAVSTVPNCRAIIYSVSWAPADLNCLVAGTSEGKVFIWDLTKGKVLQDFKGHKKNKVYCVAWNQKDSRRIVSVGESCTGLVHEVSGQQLQAYIHPEPLYGADWQDANTLATACRDGCIRVFNVLRSGSEPLTLLKGHSKKVFRVKWNPVMNDILCSGSDDCTVCVWSVSKAQCLSVLVGHTDNVRGLAWCPELPHLLVSGSWDRSIKVWDARSATCLDTVTEHGADIYGLSIHPGRPFLVASCSRDSTVRLWSMTWFVAPLQLRLLAGHPLQEVIASPEEVAAQQLNDVQLSDMQLRLSGARAQHLLALQTTTTSNNRETFQQHKLTRVIADVFAADVHVRNLWDLLSVVCFSAPVSSLSPHYRTSLVHHSHLASCSVAEAERQLQSSSVASAVRGEQQADLDALAVQFLESGALRQYCEATVRAGAWDRALAVAPAVSLPYWRSLLARYCDKLVSEESGSCVAYLTAAHDADRLLDYHLVRGDVKAAFRSCVAMSCVQPRNTQRAAEEERESRPCVSATPEVGEPLVSSRLQECAGVLAEWYLNRGSPVQASCALLAADHYSGCLLYLLRGHELELLLSAARMLLSSKVCPSSVLAPFIDTALTYLAHRALALNLPHVALDFALAHSKGVLGLTLQCCVVLSSDTLAKDALLARSDLPTFLRPPHGSSQQTGHPLLDSEPDDPLSTSADQQALADASGDLNVGLSARTCTSTDVTDEPPGVANTPITSDSTAQTSRVASSPVSGTEWTAGLNEEEVQQLRGIMAGLMSDGRDRAVQAALLSVTEAMQQMDLSSPRVWLLVQLLQACPVSLKATERGTDGVTATDSVRWSASILAVSAATGAVKASALEYFSIVSHLLTLARVYVERNKAQHGAVIESFVGTLQARLEERDGKRTAVDDTVLGVKVGKVLKSWTDKGATRVCGSHLPRHSRTCYVTRTSVKGPTYTIREGDAVLGLNEALMLAKVHPFSPVGSCSRLRPF
ncbi:WD40 repeat, partial [Trinorchestia longiramus]